MAALERRAAEISAMEAELAAARTEREALTATVAALEAERAERLAEIARRTEEIARLRAGALASDDETPVAANDAGDNMRKAIESIEAEKSSLEARLAALEADHAVVLTENADLRRTAANGSDAHAADEAIRERLAEIAAHVLRLTGQPPEAPAGDAAPPAQRGDKGNGGPRLHAVSPGGEAAPAPAGEAPKPDQGRSLAERIRALQQASRH